MLHQSHQRTPGWKVLQGWGAEWWPSEAFRGGKWKCAGSCKISCTNWNGTRYELVEKGLENVYISRGQSGLGKSTLVNTLFKSKVSRKSCTPNYEEKISKTVQLQSVSHSVWKRTVIRVYQQWIQSQSTGNSPRKCAREGIHHIWTSCPIQCQLVQVEGVQAMWLVKPPVSCQLYRQQAHSGPLSFNYQRQTSSGGDFRGGVLGAARWRSADVLGYASPSGNRPACVLFDSRRFSQRLAVTHGNQSSYLTKDSLTRGYTAHRTGPTLQNPACLPEHAGGDRRARLGVSQDGNNAISLSRWENSALKVKRTERSLKVPLYSREMKCRSSYRLFAQHQHRYKEYRSSAGGAMLIATGRPR
ncbi:hypothetical protein NFI96_002891 [Prochilodus magdalenae]|nr:hypothetical protein NFI96_002891 [Prochilodus magdalenae]